MKAGQPLVISAETVAIAHRPGMASGDLIQAAVSSINQVIESTFHFMSSATNLPKEIPRKITSVHYVLSTPWALSQAKDVVLNFDKDTNVSRQYILDLIDSERSRLVVDDIKSELTVVEEKISEVRLNGYPVHEWEGKPTRNLEVTYVVTLAGTKTINIFKGICKHFVSEKRVFFHSSLLLQYIGLRKVKPDLESYMLTHIHGELTDLAGILRNSCIFFGSFPMGSLTVIRGVAAESHSDEHTADSMLALFTRKDLDASFSSGPNASVELMSAKWIETLRTVSSKGQLSNAVMSLVIISSSAILCSSPTAFAALNVAILKIS
jgi:hypothetical protein